MSLKYAYNNILVTCSCGTVPTFLRVTSDNFTNLYGIPLATEGDRWPCLNIMPMGMCMVRYGYPCFPSPVTWINPEEGVSAGGYRLLTENSKALCVFGGLLSLHFFKFPLVNKKHISFKRPSDYLADLYDWIYEKYDNIMYDVHEYQFENEHSVPAIAGTYIWEWSVEMRLSFMKSVATSTVGAIETVWDILQDPCGDGKEIIEGKIEQAKQILDNPKEFGKEFLKEKVADVAEQAHEEYKEIAAFAENHPEFVDQINDALKKMDVKGKFAYITNKELKDLGWMDLVYYWWLELESRHGDENKAKLKFGPDAQTTKDLKIHEGVLDCKQLAIDKIKAGDLSTTEYTWKYGINQYFNTILELDAMTFFLGSYSTTVDVTDNGDGTYQLKYKVTNTSGWESGTRFRRDNDGNKQNDGIIPDKERGDGVDMGGNMSQEWTWEEPYDPAAEE